ncbi:MAG: hypothetical protein IT257_09255 [Chitinophagaceae bacterium]|nr:hypothetical protein [Chitinophagaceae bacterium]
MKSTIKLLFAMAIMLCAISTFAQAPHLFNYQGIARDLKGNPMSNKKMAIKIAVLPAADATVAEYEEVQLITTNEFGLYTLQIGNGTAVSGTMKSVKWETGNKYIKVAIDPAGGTNYVDAGTNQLLSVPYALYADMAGNANGHDKTRTGAVNSNAAHVAGDVNYLTKFTALNTIGKSQIFDNGTGVGLGTATPSAGVKLHIRANGNTEYIRMQQDDPAGFGKFLMQSDIVGHYATFTKYNSLFPGAAAGTNMAALYPFGDLLAFGNNNGGFLLSNNGNVGIGVLSGGNTVLKFNAVQSTGFLGLGGNAIPASNVHINNAAASATVKISNNTTGHLVTDGLDISNTGNAASVMNKENSTLALGTNNSTVMTLTNAGNAEFAGQIKVAGGAPGVGKLLSSDATGLGSWNTAASLGLVSGSGTVNRVPKFTPNGTTLGNSLITDNANEIGVGTSPFSGSTINVGGTATVDTPSVGFHNSLSGDLGTIFLNASGQLQFTPNTSNPALAPPTLTLDDDGGGATFADNVEVNGRVGVGTNTPIAKIHAISGAQVDTAIFATTSSGGSKQVGVFGTYNTAGFGAGIVGRGFGGGTPPASTDIGVYGSSSGTAVWSAGTLRVSASGEAAGRTLTCVNASGDAVWSGAIAFRATSFNTAINAGTTTTIIYPTEVFDEGADYNPATGEFTVPESGVYTFSYTSTHQALAAYATGNVFTNFQVNGTSVTGSPANFEPSKVTFWNMQNTTTLKLVAGDVVTVTCSNNTNVNINANANNTFNGYKVR